MEALYVNYIGPLKQYLMNDCLGGPRPTLFRYLINVQKGCTGLYVLALMFYFDNWSWAAHIYLANHGIYGVIWLLKDMTVPDPVWQTNITILSTLIAGTGLGLYWVAGYIVVAHRVEVSPTLGALCIAMNTLGSTLMLATDTQKFYTLKYKKGLISDGWLTWSRNTNYFGEMMIYLSFALLAKHWIPFAWLGFMWSIVFMTNMVYKDVSLRKKEGGAEYFAKAGFLVPNLVGWAKTFSSDPKRAKVA